MIKVRDIMTRDVITLAPEMSLADAAELLTSRHVSGAPVVNGSTVVGVLSITDILQFVGEHTMDLGGRKQDEASLLMTEELDGPASFFDDVPDDAEADLADLLEIEREVSGDLLTLHKVEDVMTRSLLTLRSATEVPVAADYMRRSGVHRILVVDEGRLVGIVSSMDVVRAVADHKLEVRRLVFDRAGISVSGPELRR